MEGPLAQSFADVSDANAVCQLKYAHENYTFLTFGYGANDSFFFNRTYSVTMCRFAVLEAH
jgi:hypothetical protein